ncbi:MAG: hypothetical protein IMX02_00540 [Limnochordaceae bacterium]|nr:hypothetical protein [Limnochordaceae bacterium]
MNPVTHTLSVSVAAAAFAVSTAFAAMVLRRFGRRPRSLHLLLWGIGLLLYAAGAAAQVHRGLYGFSEAGFRLWYLTGAVLVAAYLGQGTAYLLLPRRVAHLLMALLAVGTSYAAFKVAGAQLDPARAAGVELSGAVIVSPGVRVLTPFFNVYGTLLLVGGAVWSAWAFRRRRTHYDRMIGNVLIALGGLAPAIGGTLNRFGLPGLYVGELVGAVVMYLGFLKATSPEPVRSARPAPHPAPGA